MPSLAHFGLSLCIHVFVYIMRNTAASLDTNLSRFGQHCVWYMNGNVSFLWIQVFFFFSATSSSRFFSPAAEYARPPFEHHWIESASEKVILIWIMRQNFFFFFFFPALITWSLQSTSAEQHILEVIPAPLKSSARRPEPLQISSRSPPRFCRCAVTDPRRHYQRPASSLE